MGKGNETKENERGKKPGVKSSNAAIVGVAAVFLILAGFVFFFGFGSGTPQLPTPSPGAINPFDTEPVKLLLASYDNGAALERYNMSYRTDENGFQISYAVASNGTHSWASIRDPYGSLLSGNFGAGNASTVLCLKYDSPSRCAKAGNYSDMQDIANRVRSYLPDRRTYALQKTKIQDLIRAGAMKFSPASPKETVGAFETKKISYVLDYGNLTIQKLAQLGLTSNDPGIYLTTRVTKWIDGETGLEVKSMAEIYRGGKLVGTYLIQYDALGIGTTAPLPEPGGMVEANSFMALYNEWMDELQAKETCLAASGTERDACFKNLAVGKKKWDLCKLIGSSGIYEECTLVVAQETNNHVLCEKLQTLADDCYIAIAGKTGNFELCKKISDSGLAGACSAAATDGKRIMDGKQQEIAKMTGLLGCGNDADCAALGNFGQFCLPKNSTAAGEDGAYSEQYGCLKETACACLAGFCGFDKNSSYYSCLGDIEAKNIEDYIKSLMPDDASNATNNASNGTAAD